MRPAAAQKALNEVVAKGAMPPLVLVVESCGDSCKDLSALGVEFTQESTDRHGAVDAGFRDPCGNGWKMIEVGKKSKS